MEKVLTIMGFSAGSNSRRGVALIQLRTGTPGGVLEIWQQAYREKYLVSSFENLCFSFLVTPVLLFPIDCNGSILI